MINPATTLETNQPAGEKQDMADVFEPGREDQTSIPAVAMASPDEPQYAIHPTANELQVSAKYEAETQAPTNRSSLPRQQNIIALIDLWDGLRRWPLWFTIGWLEIRQRYRRSLIGPLWITLSVGIFVAGLGLVYSSLFRMPIADYLPYLTTGIVIWTFLSTMLLEGCSVFIAAEGAIKQNPVPISVHVYRVAFRNLIILAHNAIIYLALIALFPVKVNASLFLLPIGLALAILSGLGMVLILGILSTRFRDIPLIVTNLVQVLFFTTPIFWKAETLPVDRRWVAEVNPFYHLIEIQRAPLLGTIPPLKSYMIAGFFAIMMMAIGVALYSRFCRRIAYWL